MNLRRNRSGCSRLNQLELGSFVRCASFSPGSAVRASFRKAAAATPHSVAFLGGPALMSGCASVPQPDMAPGRLYSRYRKGSAPPARIVLRSNAECWPEFLSLRHKATLLQIVQPDVLVHRVQHQPHAVHGPH